MDAPSPPAVPDPVATASAQAEANAGTATAQTALNNANTVTPLGDSNWAVTGSQSYTNPDGTTSSVPTYTQTQTLSKPEQALFNQQATIGEKANHMAIQEEGNLENQLANPLTTTPLQTSVAPTSGSVEYSPGYSGAIQTSVPNNASEIQTSVPNNSGQIQTGVNSYVGGIQTNLGSTDYTAATQAAQQAAYARMQPALQQQQSQLTAQLASQGISPGSTAYNNAMQLFGQQQNDAINSSIATGDAEQAQLYGENLSTGNFVNAADAQEYNQGTGAATFANTALGQQFGQNLAAGTFADTALGEQQDENIAAGDFANTAQSQQYGENANNVAMNNAAQQQQYGENLNSASFTNAASAQQLQQQIAEENQPLNEAMALESGGQVSMPQFAGYNPGSVGTTPISADTYASANLAQQQYQTQVQQDSSDFGSIFGALGSLGGAAIKYSDPALKTDHGVVGKIGKIPVHEFNYQGDPTPLRGFMADEVKKVAPKAVKKTKSGFDAVDYAKALANA